MATRPVIPADAARTLLLDAQGLLADPSRRVTYAVLRGLIEQMGFVQLDSICVVERAHHLTLASRLHGYRHRHLRDLLERRRLLFEHWTHDASAIPVAFYGHWKHRFVRSRDRWRRSPWWTERMGTDPEGVIAHVMDRIRADGPLMSKDFEHERGQASSWWGWKPQKAALEYLWHCGELAVAGRRHFHKIYDLPERVHPDAHAAPRPDRAALIDWAASGALSRLGVATATELAAFWRAITAAEARAWCEAASRDGRAIPVLVESVDGSAPRASFASPDHVKRLDRAAGPPRGVRLMSPFDPVVRDRARLSRWFGFDYRFEAFVPAAKRVYGYYVLPLLEGDRFVGRVDLKTHRREGVLEVRGLWWERGVKPTRARRASLDDALERLGALVGTTTIRRADCG
ncbi:MAG: YcaQ family DNA glycosylase [Phycisphaerales bacterium]|nr:YcaQ family DNA glycosylase [Phycisphaerales bacterium]